MKKKLNTIFFSMCFLAALMAEVYCFIVLDGDLFSVVGIGIVVLITGYLLMDSIQSKLVQSGESLKYYVDRMYREEAEKWSERYTELMNIQKATYSATKKNTVLMAEQLEELLARLEILEDSNTKALQKIAELQKKSLEGQKNALNLEINYNKQNTLQLIHSLREEADRLDSSEQLTKILSALEKNNKLMKGYINGLKGLEGGKQDSGNDLVEEDYKEEWIHNQAPDLEEASEETISFEEAYEEEQDALENTEDENETIENASDTTWSVVEDQAYEAYKDETDLYEEVTEDIVKPTVIPLYDDPNKNLTADEIAALFASYGQ